MPTVEAPSPDAREWRLTGLFFLLLLVFHGWAMSVGWKQGNLPGNEFRQSQTAITALFIQRDADFSLTYPTPVMGQPWSVPMEFPLYQWTVVKLSNATGWGLIPAGRAVSALCFYGALAALFPLLGALQLAPSRRLIVMGLVLTSPLYIFYSRSFLIETMALMFSVWFLVAFGRMITAPTWGRLALVAALGVPAGLVKVTTYIVFLLPACLWTLLEMRRQFAIAGPMGAARRGAWALGAIALPVLLTARWTRFADEVKHLNSSAGFLESDSLMNFNLGTVSNRFSALTLGSHWHNISANLASPLLLAAGLVLAVTVGRRWWRQIALCFGCYLASLAAFPTLYAWHDYYAVANGLLLLAALGIASSSLLDLRPRWLPWVLLLGLHAAQVWTYQQRYFGMQHGPIHGGNDMTQTIERATNPGEMIIVSGYDWDSSVPFYSGRRALMIRNGMERDSDYMDRAFKAQAGGRVALLVVRNTEQPNTELLRIGAQYFDLDPRPVFRWRDITAYAPKRLRARMANTLRDALKYSEVRLDESMQGEKWPPADREVLTEDLMENGRDMFAECTPLPWKFYAQFGTYRTREDERAALFAHPVTRLWFKVPAGRHRMRVECAIEAAAYAGPVQDRTDGVEFLVERERADGTRERLGSLYLDPARVAADAGWHVLEVTGDFSATDNLVLSTGPGPAGSFARDWAVIGAVKIE